MSCSPFDIRDYFLNELAANERRQVEVHVKSCAGCRDEFDRLRVMDVALRSVVEEEIPQRIAFVSDKIFEPSPWKRGLAAFWNSGARLGFVAAAMLACALVYSAATRPAVVTQQVPVMASAGTATAAPAMSEQEIQRRIELAVGQAVSASEKRQQVVTARLVKELSSEHSSLLLAADENQYLQKVLKEAKKLQYGAETASLQEAPR